MSLRIPGLGGTKSFAAQGLLADPSFYPSPRLAAKAPPETLAYVAVINARDDGRPDAIAVVDVDPSSPTRGQVLERLELPNAGDELHHFGWNACSSALCPYAPHPHVQRRYLIVPGLRSSRIYVVDTKPDGGAPRAGRSGSSRTRRAGRSAGTAGTAGDGAAGDSDGRLRIVKTIEPEDVEAKTGYSRIHTVHCGPEGIYISALGAPDGGGPGGVFLLDHATFEPLGQWEIDRGPQHLAYDFAWHLGYDVMITSEWGTPNIIEKGLDLDALMTKRYGQAIHVWDLRRRRHLQRLAVDEHDQITLELRPAHDPTKPYGFVGVVVNLKDLASSVWLWHRDGDKFAVTKVLQIDAEPADPELLPPALKPFSAVPPLVSDIDLSVDDRFLYVSCWGTGELRQYDVTDPFHPRHTATVQLGGIVRHAAHPKSGPLNGGPQMVEVSRDGRRVYVTNSLYIPWDAQFYPEGIRGWMAKLDADPNGGLTPDPELFVEFPEGLRPHQVRLEGGDASSDSYCYP